MLPKYKALLKEAAQRDVDYEGIKLCGELLSLTTKLTAQCDKKLSEFGLLEGRFVSMLMINDAGEIAPHELATQVGLTRASITAVIDFLESKDYAVRLPSLKDRRSLQIKIKPEGEQVLKVAIESQLTWLENLTSSLNSQEREMLHVILKKINENI
jgi:MarR family transcriptional regulator, negative regulator of the multidrug operon emrRAB